jgi:hypothetical protein
MLYLKAAEIVETMPEYNGIKGMFIKTFALSDKRNKNGWRVTWDSIKRRIATFVINKRPGIEYVKCEEGECDLDHTDGATKEQAVKTQEQYRKTTIIDYTLDESNHKAYFIHQTTDREFFEKIQRGEIRFVSPSIWPTPGAYEILGRTERGMLKIDVYDWDGLHDAFVNNPAFGDEAKIVSTCEGDNCHVRMMTAAQMEADGLDPLKQVSILVRHKDKLHFVSVSKEVAEKIQALYDNGNSVDEAAILSVLKLNNSFSACSCSANQMDQKEHDEKINAMKKAMEEKDEKIKELESKLSSQATAQKASLVAALQSIPEDEREEFVESFKATAKDADVKIIDEALKEAKSFKARKDEQPKEDPRIKALEAKLAAPLITEMLKAREENGASKDELESFEKSLKAKTYAQIEEQYNNEKILLKSVSAKSDEEKVHFEWGNGDGTALQAKSLEEIFGEEN